MVSPAKGHWPKGKVRNRWLSSDWPSTRSRILDLVDHHRLPKVRSRRALASHLGVDFSTVAQWLREIDHPPESVRAKLLAWIKVQDREIHRKASRK